MNYTVGIGSDQRGFPIVRLSAVLQCQGCRELILGCVSHIQNGLNYAYHLHYPLGKPNDSVALEIPEHIKPDFSEALRCLWVDAYNATAEMCRRALEASCLDLGAPHKDVLEDMIDWLADQRKITPFLQQAAHKIRFGGNRGAHPTPATPATATTAVSAASMQPAVPKPVTKIEKEHAEAIVKFTHEFFHHVYVGPKQLERYDFSKPKVPNKRP